jgi:hypothetical protein
VIAVVFDGKIKCSIRFEDTRRLGFVSIRWNRVGQRQKAKHVGRFETFLDHFFVHVVPGVVGLTFILADAFAHAQLEDSDEQCEHKVEITRITRFRKTFVNSPAVIQSVADRQGSSLWS